MQATTGTKRSHSNMAASVDPAAPLTDGEESDEEISYSQCMYAPDSPRPAHLQQPASASHGSSGVNEAQDTPPLGEHDAGDAAVNADDAVGDAAGAELDEVPLESRCRQLPPGTDLDGLAPCDLPPTRPRGERGQSVA